MSQNLALELHSSLVDPEWFKLLIATSYRIRVIGVATKEVKIQ
jgi:hypothetical protein